MIPIQNIYYMLSYAFQILKEQGYKSLETEPFHNVSELYASILSKGISTQLKQGLGRGYVWHKESLSSPRGRIDISESIRTRSMLKKQLICSYDEFSVDTYMNRIIKTTMELLLRANISKNLKKELRRLLVFFSDIQTLDIHRINWNIQYYRHTQSYRMLISICYLVIKDLLQTNADGTIYLMDYLDEQRMSRLYEKFILEYYRQECPEIEVSSSRIVWAVDDGFNTMLPTMQTDVMLAKGNDILIIEAKYYSKTTQEYFDAQTIHSANLYQIFTYVKNKSSEFGDKNYRVSGLLLYAATDEDIQPNHLYQMSGNQISVKTLDLNCDFSQISAQLNEIVDEHFGSLKKS